MVSNIRNNIMGTVSFEGSFDGMRKSQEFIVYPMHKGGENNRILIQSDTRIGHINLDTGDVTLSPPRSGGSYSCHLILSKNSGQVSKEELAGLKYRIFQTAGDKVGNNSAHVYTDNSNASNVAIF